MLKLEQFKDAKKRLDGVIKETKLIYSPTFSEECGNEVYIKPENLQITGAFKIRGAYNRIALLDEEAKSRGLIASSAGNHAQGVAYAAQKLGVKATIVMPKSTPLIKVEATKQYGAEVVLAGEIYDEAYAEAKRLQEINKYEFIHPFNDGNGRTGRIVNILYLILKDLLDIPVLYLSRYIITHKADYYRLLQEVRTQDKWEEWILYMLDAVEQTSLETIELINNISDLMIKTQDKILQDLPKIYSKDLVEILFMHPYTKIDFLVDRLNITRKTASKYLNELEYIGILKNIQIKNSKFFINIELFNLLRKGI